jgi:NADH-quinone oxidoreductase subunit J
MAIGDVVFYVLALVTVGSAAVVVLARSLIYSAFSLLFTFFGVAGLYVLLGADFLAATQLLIYVGGILVLLLFGVMLTHKLYDLDLKSEVTQFGPGAIVAAGLFVVLAATARRTEWMTATPRPPAPTTEAIGEAFLGPFLLPFEAASILLLVALIGAAMIVRRKKDA